MNVNLKNEIAKLTVAQAHKAFFRAIENCDMAKAHAIQDVLRMASKPLREALDYARSRVHKAKAGKLGPSELTLAEAAEANLLLDLNRISDVIHWEAPALRQPEGPTLAQALALAGIKAGERA